MADSVPSDQPAVTSFMHRLAELEARGPGVADSDIFSDDSDDELPTRPPAARPCANLLLVMAAAVAVAACVLAAREV